METYTVQITQMLMVEESITAKDEDEAIQLVEQLYQDGEISMLDSLCIQTEYNVINNI